MIPQKDKERIRELAAKWMELANEPVMEERKEAWKKVHDVQGYRPVILIETSSIDGFVSEEDLLCTDPLLRAVERYMVETVRHAEEVGDDIIVEPYFRLGWQIEESDFGVPVETKPATTSTGQTSLGYTFNFPIKTPEDFTKLKSRTVRVNREKTDRYRKILDETFGDILPIKLGNYDPLKVEDGDEGWVGMFFFALTWQVYRFIGNDRLLYWVYDNPDMIHKLMDYMVEERLRVFRFLEEQGLLVPNTDNQMAGPRAYGYVSDLPGADTEGPAKLKDCWGWPESQESTIISPDMFKEFVLPYYARVAKHFGLVYYGCCEPVDDRIDLIMEAMPNLRSVSISGWANFEFMAEKLGKDYVYSRKPTPALLSGENPDWNLVEEDMKKTYDAVRKHGNSIELLFRDLYTIAGDRPRLKKWVEMTKKIFGM